MNKKTKRTIKRRRREGKTDYALRIKMLRSEMPRIVVRKTNKYLIAQYVESEAAQDKVIIGVSSKELLENSWPESAKGSLKSIPACYLTGLLLAKKMKDKKKLKAILDMGLERNIKKSRIYALLKGLVDGGINIAHNKEVLPEEKRILGEHLKNKINVNEIKNKLK